MARQLVVKGKDQWFEEIPDEPPQPIPAGRAQVLVKDKIDELMPKDIELKTAQANASLYKAPEDVTQEDLDARADVLHYHELLARKKELEDAYKNDPWSVDFKAGTIGGAGKWPTKG